MLWQTVGAGLTLLNVGLAVLILQTGEVGLALLRAGLIALGRRRAGPTG